MRSARGRHPHRVPGKNERVPTPEDVDQAFKKAMRERHRLRRSHASEPAYNEVVEYVPDTPYEEWHYQPRGTATDVHDRWAEFNWVLNDLSYISGEVIRNAKKGVRYETDSTGKLVVMPTTLGPGADLGIYEERLAKANELRGQLNAEVEEWSKRTGNPAPDLSQLNRDFEPMTMDTHRFAHRQTMELSNSLFKEWEAKYHPRRPEVG